VKILLIWLDRFVLALLILIVALGIYRMFPTIFWGGSTDINAQVHFSSALPLLYSSVLCSLGYLFSRLHPAHRKPHGYLALIWPLVLCITTALGTFLAWGDWVDIVR